MANSLGDMRKIMFDPLGIMKEGTLVDKLADPLNLFGELEEEKAPVVVPLGDQEASEKATKRKRKANTGRASTVLSGSSTLG